MLENAGYSCTIDQLYSKIKEIILPEDISIELIQTHVGVTRYGCPSGIIDALISEGWKSTENMRVDEIYKVYIYHSDDIPRLKRVLWAESNLSSMVWSNNI